MTKIKMTQRDLIALEKDLALVCASDLQSIKVAEKAIEALLTEAQRLIATTDDRDLSFAHVLENLLLLHPNADVLSHLGYNGEVDLSSHWTGSLLLFEGDPEVFSELYSAVTHLKVFEDSQSRRRHGAKGGARQRITDLREEVIGWWNTKGWQTRTNKSSAIDWLIANWASFCDEHGIISGTPAPHRNTLYRYLKGLKHKSE
jgi:hypothetical protein